MAIILEDGSVVSGANSYVTAAELDAYAAERGITITGDGEVLLHKAMDYLESTNFIGDRYSRDQSLQWPRLNVYIDGYAYDIDTIPQMLKDAQFAVAIAIGDDADPLSIITRETKREKVGEIEVEYKDSTVQAATARTISAALYKLTKSGGGFNVSVQRG